MCCIIYPILRVRNIAILSTAPDLKLNRIFHSLTLVLHRITQENNYFIDKRRHFKYKDHAVLRLRIPGAESPQNLSNFPENNRPHYRPDLTASVS